MKISELLSVKIENTILKLQQLQQSAEPLQSLQRELVESARSEVGASKEAQYNPATQEFIEPKSAPEAS